MDELLNKYLGEEINETEFNTKLSALSEVEKKEFDVILAKPETVAKISAKAKEELDKVSGLRKESKRISDKDKPVDSSAKFREENITKATTAFFQEFAIPQAEQQEYLDSFNKNDSGNVSPDLIYGDFKKIFATRNADELLKTKKDYDSMKDGAHDFNRGAAGNPGGTGGGGVGEGEKEKSSQAAREWVAEGEKQGMHLDPEKVERVLTQGMKRIIE